MKNIGDAHARSPSPLHRISGPAMMPEPNRLTCLVDQELAGAPLELLIEQDAVIALECHACHHEAFWRADDLRRKFPHRAGLTFGLIGPRLRGSQCRSE